MKLNDKQKKQIVADYIECENYSEVARKYKVSRTTIQKIVKSNPKSCELLQIKKEENSADILAYMESKKTVVCGLIDTYLQAMTDKAKIDKATVNQLSTALGTVIDKFTMTNNFSNKEDGNVVKIIDDIGE